jgi:hypothetical protein
VRSVRLLRAIRGAALAGLLGLSGCAAAGAPLLALADAAAGVMDELLTPKPVAAASAAPASPMQAAIQSRSKQRAMTVAQKEARLHGWPGVSILDARFENGRWEITLQRLPAMPDGRATAQVSAKGELLDFEVGDD